MLFKQVVISVAAGWPSECNVLSMIAAHLIPTLVSVVSAAMADLHVQMHSSFTVGTTLSLRPGLHKADYITICTSKFGRYQ